MVAGISRSSRRNVKEKSKCQAKYDVELSWRVRNVKSETISTGSSPPQSPLHHIINTFRTGNTPTLCHQATHSLPINYHQSLNDNPDCFMSMLILVFTLCLPGDSEYSVEFYELQELQRLVVTEVEGFHTHSNGLRDSISRV